VYSFLLLAIHHSSSITHNHNTVSEFRCNINVDRGGTGIILLANSETSYVAQDSILVLNATSPNSQLRKLGYSQFANSIKDGIAKRRRFLDILVNS
jgi:hypothetical protein